MATRSFVSNLLVSLIASVLAGLVLWYLLDQKSDLRPGIGTDALATEVYGIEIWQNGQTVPMQRGAAPYDPARVTLDPAPFELRFPDRLWQGEGMENRAMQIVVSTDPLIHVDPWDRDTGPMAHFMPGMAYAAVPIPNDLMTSGHGCNDLGGELGKPVSGMNYLIRDRLRQSEAFFLSMLVSSITDFCSKAQLLGGRAEVHLLVLASPPPARFGVTQAPAYDRITLTFR